MFFTHIMANTLSSREQAVKLTEILVNLTR